MYFHIEKVRTGWRWFLVARNGVDVGRSMKDDYRNRSSILAAINSIRTQFGGNRLPIWDAENEVWLS